MVTSGKRKNSPMAPYFVQLREFERRLLRDAVEAGGDIHAAARMLGVTSHYAKARAKLLGGVVGDEPKHEPPGRAADAWNTTIRSARDRKRDRAALAEGAHQLDHPDGPRCACGEPSAHESGACAKCAALGEVLDA